MAKYELMHQNVPCGLLSIDENTGHITAYKNNKNGQSPFLGHADLRRLQKWWEGRAVPASRKLIQQVIREAGCLTTESYLTKNLALSMTDAYWIRPEGTDLLFDNVKLTNMTGHNDGKVPYHNSPSYDQNASLGGQMDKYWDLSVTPPELVKESYRYFGQQAVNEAVATMIHDLQDAGIPYTRYRIEHTEDNGILCRCAAFTDERHEFVPAYEVIEGARKQNDISLYEAYIQTCISLGIEEEAIRTFMDYQTLTDFVISNQDEHLNNFGILRDPQTMRYLGAAPVFDSGNSMFFDDKMHRPRTRAEILELRITGFYQAEERLLRNVRYKLIVKEDLLPHPNIMKDIYANANIPEWKAEIISKNYETKLIMLKEFQHGKSFSLYREKRSQSQPTPNKPQNQGESELQKMMERYTEKAKKQGNHGRE